jgi:cation transport regulator ChaB
MPNVKPTTKRPPISDKQIEKDPDLNAQPDTNTQVKAELKETDNYFRNIIEKPSLFQKDSFKTIIFSKEKGIKAIVAKKKDETSLTIQSILFEKDKWTKDEANKWLKDHDYSTVEVASLPDIEDAPYHKLEELPDNVKKLSKHLQDLWMRTWNAVYAKDKDESKAFRIAWYQVHQEENKKK